MAFPYTDIMKGSVMKNEDVIERLPLEHPLPEEIQHMQRDDTVCQFCGVSYLIHREVKTLETQLKKLTLELARYEGSEERERKLRDDLARTFEEKEATIITAREKDILNRNLTAEIEDVNCQMKEVTQTKENLESRLNQEMKSSVTLRKWTGCMRQRLPTIQSTIRQQKSELHNVHTFVLHMVHSLGETCGTIVQTVSEVCIQANQEVMRLKEDLARLTLEHSSCLSDRGELEGNLRLAQAEVERLGRVERDVKVERKRASQVNSQIERLQTDLDEAAAQRRTLTSETAQLQEIIRSKSREITDGKAQHRKREQISEQLTSKLQLELKQKSSELQVALCQHRELQREISDRARDVSETERLAQLSTSEKEQLQQALKRGQEECNALKAEREMLITSHQNRIEQLRESFRQKVSEADKWQPKIDEMLGMERTRHAGNIQQLEDKLQETYQVELDIEKQKHQELVAKYKGDFQEVENKLKTEIHSLNSRHKTEQARMENHLAFLKTQASTTEASLKEEVNRSKAVLADLQSRIGDEGAKNDEVVARMRAEIRESEQDLISSREETGAVIEKLARSKEEIIFLQEIVRKECEERFELTETLSDVKEQLLTYQRHGGVTSPQQQQHPASTTTTISEASFGSSCRTSAGSIQGGQGHRTAGQAAGKIMSNNSFDIGFESNQARPPGNRTSRGGSMSDSRQRIAAAVGRR